MSNLFAWNETIQNLYPVQPIPTVQQILDETSVGNGFHKFAVEGGFVHLTTEVFRLALEDAYDPTMRDWQLSVKLWVSDKTAETNYWERRLHQALMNASDALSGVHHIFTQRLKRGECKIEARDLENLMGDYEVSVKILQDYAKYMENLVKDKVEKIISNPYQSTP
jgi:hypothetical protein